VVYARLPEVVLQYQFWYYLLPRSKFGHFKTYYFHVDRHYLVQFLITDLKRSKHNDKQKRGRYQDT